MTERQQSAITAAVTQFEPSEFTHPVETMEPLADIPAARKAAQRCIQVIEQSIAAIVTAENPCLAAWQVAFATGNPCCQGRSMDEVARILGVTRAAISKGSKIFQRGTGIGISGYGKTKRACRSYSKARRETLQSAAR